MAPAMPCKTCKKSKHWEIRSKTHDFKSNFACISEASESKRMLVWKNLCQIIMRTILQERETIHYKVTIWYRNLFLCLKLWKFLLQKQQWIKYGKNLEKILAWDLTKVRNKSEVIDEARTKCRKVHFASLMDICHLKNAELETKHQKYKGRGDILNDDFGPYAVFTEQGSSASQMTAAKVMDNISRLPWSAGQSADAVSACTLVNIEDAPKLLKIPKSECQDIWIRLPSHQWPKSWSSMEHPVVPLERHLYGHSLAGLLWERQFEKTLLKYGWEKVSTWECLFVHREKGFFSSVYVDDIKLAGKKQNIDPMWEVMPRNVWNDIVSWQTTRLNNCTKYLLHASMTITSKRKNWNL